MATDFDRGSMQGGFPETLLRFILIAAFAALLFGGYALLRFRGLDNARAMEQVQIARNLARGEGFTTQCLRPADLALLARDPDARKPSVKPSPDIRNAPVYPWLLSTAFRLARPRFTVQAGDRIFDAEKTVVLPFGIVCCALTGLLILLLGNRLFEMPIGFVAMVVWFVTPGVLDAAVSGTALPLHMLLATAAVYAAVLGVQAANGERGSAWWLPAILAAALLCGAAVLCGWPAVAYGVILGSYIWLAMGRLRLAATLLFGVLAAGVLVPWLMRQQAVSGHWFGAGWPSLLNGTALFPGLLYDRGLDTHLAGMYMGRVLQQKLVTNLGASFAGNLQAAGGGIVLTACFLLSYLGSYERDETNLLRWGLLGGLLYLVCAGALLDPGPPPAIALLWPLAILYGVAFFHITMDAHGLVNTGWQPLLTWVLVLLTAVPAITAAAFDGPQSPYPPYYAPLVRKLDDVLEPDDAVCADIPAAVAWYADRPCVLLPASVETFKELHEQYGPLHGLYLTTQTADRPYARDLLDGPFASWLAIVNRYIPPDFPFTQGIELVPGRRDQLLLTDRLPAP